MGDVAGPLAKAAFSTATNIMMEGSTAIRSDEAACSKQKAVAQSGQTTEGWSPAHS